MSEKSQFWLNWVVAFISSAGTTLAVIVALFGEKIKSHFFPPRLSLGLLKSSGELCRMSDGTLSRWYHLEVKNEANWPSAHGVQVYLTGIYENGNEGMSILWKGDAPLRWRHQEVQPLSRIVGAPYSCDLCFVSKENGLHFATLITPYNLNEHNYRKGKIAFLVDIEARSDEGTLVSQRYNLLWDGHFSEQDSEMEKRMIITLLDNL